MEEEPDHSLSREDEHSQSPAAAEKLACHRCRQRKVKCDRESPCSQCLKAGTQCSYVARFKPRERRQRVMVSHTYDSKLDAISRKIDALIQKLNQLSHEPTRTKGPGLVDFADPLSISQDEPCSSSSFGPTPSSPVESTLHPGTRPYCPPGGDAREVQCNLFKAEYEGESSLFAHALFATRFLQNAINNTTNAEVAHEMETVLDSLTAAVHHGQQQSDALDRLYPHARAIPSGSSTRNLPLPPFDKVFTCLRMARECLQVTTLWLGDYITPAQFNEYFIKIASPGPATEADLIIVHCGLYWLFCECSKATTDEEAKRDYEAQAFICEANLQTVLANLRFHQPATMDTTYAMGIASLYCLQKNKPTAAWKFITSASHMIQALGLQHSAPAGTDGPEEKAKKSNMFWTIYMTEKTLSLRLGRLSTFRDQDITLPRPGTERPRGSFLAELVPGWVTIASIQGRICDDIYSPGALMQPPHIRASRAQALASDLRTAMQHLQDIHNHYDASRAQALGPEFHEIARRSDLVIGLSMLTLIYRSIAPEKLSASASAFCQECIDAAREALAEHDRCVAAITRARGKTVFLETYINWSIIQSPFIPFIILFCHIIETSDASDLVRLGSFVESLESASTSPAHSTYDKQRRLFRALHDVAAKYVEVKSRTGNDQRWMSMLRPVGQQNSNTIAGTPVLLDHVRMTGSPSTTDVSGPMPLHSEATAEGIGLFGDADLEMNFSGAELWDWFNRSQSMMRMLEDT
ncbi:hypothetical protein BDW72DRAFT_209715 [Aspergillus terricola var. indicus]